MKKLMYFALILVLVAGVAMFGAWTPAQAEETVRYDDAPVLSTYASEVINYTTKDYTAVQTDGGCPTYTATAGLANSCGPVGGSIIVAFYDKYYPNLIPGWDSYYASGKYRLQNSTYITPLMQELYTLMNTNVNGSGVSESEFKSGLQTYFTNHGYSASYSSVKSGSSLNFNACKTAINANKLVVLFTTPGQVYEIGESSDHDTVYSYTISGNHIMVAYGYLEVYYYNATGLFRTDTYLRVSTGLNNPKTAYYKANSSNLETACIVNVS